MHEMAKHAFEGGEGIDEETGGQVAQPVAEGGDFLHRAFGRIAAGDDLLG